jgi:opacity protein-like surface antigen
MDNNLKENMNKILALAVLALVAGTASATAVDVEYDWNHVVANKDNSNHTHYVYAGVIQPTAIGTFDFGLQGTRAQYYGFSNDDSNGWELGYSYPLTYGAFTVVPRFAFGEMNHINPDGTGYNYNAKYFLPSLEADHALTPYAGGYVAYSYMRKANADSIVKANRLQAGIDWTVTKSITLRTGLSYNKFGDQNQEGVVVIGTYGF